MRRLTRQVAVIVANKSSVALPVASSLLQTHRTLTFPLTEPPVEIEYLDSDPLQYAVRTEARHYRFDDLTYMRELAFVRINNNPTVGQFRKMTPEERRDLFWGSDRQDFYRHLTFVLLGTPEHLYHRGW